MKLEEMESKTKESQMNHPEIVSEAEWLVARKDLLAREKEFTRQRDALSAARRQLPMVKIDKDYIFDGPDGKETLADLFGGRSQLIVYHFMFGPGWEEGCKSCSYLADHFDGANWHLPHRDVTFVVVSRAPLPEFDPYKKRMGWRFKWVSSGQTDYNYDYQASFRPEDIKRKAVFYNYETIDMDMSDREGISIFYKDSSGGIFHTYSTYARGIDMVNPTYQFLDLLPKGRDEDPGDAQNWVDYHDRYKG